MNLSPIARVLISNFLLIGGVIGILTGCGLFSILPGIFAYFYLHRMIKPQIPEFTQRGHSFILNLAWNFSALSLFAFYWVAQTNFISKTVIVTYGYINLILFLGGCFLDDVRYAIKLQKQSAINSEHSS